MSNLPGPPDRWFRFPERWALDPKITPNEKAVLLALMAHRHGVDGPCFPSHEALADATDLSVSTVQRALRGLRGHGLIEWDRRRRGGNLYRILDRSPTTGQADPLIGHRRPARSVTRDRPNRSPVTDEPEEGNQMTEPESPAVTLPGMPEPVADVEPNAGHLVAAWCEGWTEARGRQPDPAVVKRVAGGCRQIARTRTSRESWQVAWHAAKDAGRQGQPDVVRWLADYRPPRKVTGANASLAVARELSSQSGPYASQQQGPRPIVGPYPPDRSPDGPL